jgi:tetratricopeptide (TPR) repeat protein
MMSIVQRKSNRCLGDEPLVGYLEGRLSPSQRATVETHLVSCSDCRQLLALYIRAVQPDISAQEQAQLEQIDLDQLAQQAKALDRIALGRPSVAPWQRRISVPLQIAASIAALASVGTLIYLLFIHQSAVEQGVLALKQAYTRQRPLELRLTGFPYAPYETHRGQDESSVDQTRLLLARERLVETVLKQGTPEAHHALGLFYLAEHNDDQALEQLKRAVAQNPEDARLHNDMGVAYWQRGERDSSAADVAQALAHFNQALAQDPDLLEAIFNRALYYQKMSLLPQAETDWQRYLKLDSSSAWAQEAKSNLELIKEKQKAVSRRSERSAEAQGQVKQISLEVRWSPVFGLAALG